MWKGLRCVPESAGINPKLLQPLFIYIYGLQLCLPPDHKCISSSPCKRARAWLNLSEYFRSQIILPLAWTLNETFSMLRKHQPGLWFSACLSSATRTSAPYKSLYLLRGIYCTARNGSKMLLDALGSLCRSCPTQPPWRLWDALLCGPLCRNTYTPLSLCFQGTLLFLSLFKGAALFPLHA